MFELLYGSGLRASELTALDLGDIDLSALAVRVMGKGRIERDAPITAQAGEALNHWLILRENLRSSTQALFVSNQGNRMSPRSLRLRIVQRAKLTQIYQRAYPHLFRHFFASHMLSASKDLIAVPELLGHANLATTLIYTQVDFDQLAAIYDSAHPRAKKRSKD